MLLSSSEFQAFLNEHFKFIENKFDGRVNLYSSKDMRLRIIQDRNQKLFMDVSVKENPEDWISLSDLRSYVLDNNDYLKETDFKSVSEFFKQSYTQIVALLNTKYSSTIEALKKRGNYRAELKWGKIK